ncbi:beta(1,3)galactosyltransferase EpsH [Candidatus Saccharibacteria bacterium]|nr:beta(1,3)galactosyltransferase EpsH [Candidatus Saccharibacteria bacterium]
MIFVTVGSQKFQFNRLLKKIDDLLQKGIIKDEVFAQIGVSDYKPKNYQCADFTTRDEFNAKLNACDLLITHGGTGVIVSALKLGKKVIAVPRLKKYGEHVDDHQIQLIDQFKELNLIEPAYSTSDLPSALQNARTKTYAPYISNTKNIIISIEQYIEQPRGNK